DHLIARDTQRIMLDATGAGRPLYENMGFRSLVRIERWEGRGSTYLGPRARPLREDDRSAVFELDTVLFGLKRTHILARLMEEFPDLGWVDYEQGRLEGYLLGRRTQAGITLGPWMCWSAASAERLLLIALEQLQGQHISLNIPDSSGRGLVLVSDHNFRRTRHSTRMIYGSASPIPSDPLAQLAVMSLATG
ncbi:MAG: hypothetical protein JXN59_11390, partial [Anaerolineae bacterium]|nr:hypothetical protein [Anaerolineae bacterium]